MNDEAFRKAYAETMEKLATSGWLKGFGSNGDNYAFEATKAALPAVRMIHLLMDAFGREGMSPMHRDAFFAFIASAPNCPPE